MTKVLRIVLMIALILGGLILVGNAQTVGNNSSSGCGSGTMTCGNAGASKVVGNGFSTCEQGNGRNGQQEARGGCTVVSSIPPQRDTAVWFDQAFVDSNADVSAATVTQFDDWCIGIADNASGVTLTTCPKSFMYGSLDMGEPSTSGHDTDWPWEGGYVADPGKTVGSATTNCPTAANENGYFWKNQTTFNGSTIPDYTSSGSGNWMLTVYGGTIGNAGSIGAAWASSYNDYALYLNLNSPSLLSYVQAVIKNCEWGANVPVDSMTGVFEDNMYPGYQDKGGSIWDSYPQGKNFGTGSSSPYGDFTYGESGTSFVAGNFYNGTIHTRTTLITTNDYTPVTFPDATDCGTSSWCNAEAKLIQTFYHSDGKTPFYFITNGSSNNIPEFITESHELGPLMEEYDVGCFGTCSANSTTVGPDSAQVHSAMGYPDGGRQIIDNLAMVYNDALSTGTNPNAHTINLMDSADSGEWAEGTANHQQNLRWHYFLPMIMQNDRFPTQWVSWINACQDTGCTDTWGWDFAQPAGRYQALPADAYNTTSGVGLPCGEYSVNYTGRDCNAGGGWSSVIECPGTSVGMYCVEFAHLYVEHVTGTAPCTEFSRANWIPACVHDIGPAFVIVNNSSSNYVISAANLQSWAPHVYSAIANGHVVSLCNPNSGYFDWTSGSTTYVYQYDSGNTGPSVCSGTSGEDFATGGAPSSGDAIYHSEALSTILGDMLSEGQAMVIVP